MVTESRQGVRNFYIVKGIKDENIEGVRGGGGKQYKLKLEQQKTPVRKKFITLHLSILCLLIFICCCCWSNTDDGSKSIK